MYKYQIFKEIKYLEKWFGKNIANNNRKIIIFSSTVNIGL